MGTQTVETTLCTCDVCGHDWYARDAEGLPDRCAKCGSPAWNRPKRKPGRPNGINKLETRQPIGKPSAQHQSADAVRRLPTLAEVAASRDITGKLQKPNRKKTG